MVVFGFDRMLACAAVLVLFLALVVPALAQDRQEPPPSAGEANVVEVVLEGNSTPIKKLPKFSTRAGQPFDPRLVEDDVRALHRSGRFIDIKPKYQRVPDGLVVIFQVVERPIIRKITYVGHKINVKKLEKAGELKVGDALDPHMIEDARRRIEEYYHEHGHAKASVTVVEGTQIKDREVVFLINEGARQRVWWTHFKGNTVASAARLRTQIQSKPGIFWFLGGYVDPKKINEDLDRLTAYYRRLGYFQAKVGRQLEYDEDYGWLTITYVINEGIRYQVRNVSVVGNEKFTAPDIQQKFTLKPGQFFNQDQLEHDLNSIRDLYGGHGHVTVDVEADTRFVEDPDQPGQVDLVYDIAEGPQYRVGRIDVHIKGENPHTRHRVIFNRLSQRPGDIVDTRLIRADEIRIKRSQLFENNPAKGQTPRIAIVMPDGDEHVAGRPRREREEKSTPRAGSNFRGQSPDRAWPAALTAPPTRTIVSSARIAPSAARAQRSGSAWPPASANGAVPGAHRDIVYRAQDPGFGGSAVGATGPDGGSASTYRPIGRTQPVQQAQHVEPGSRYFDPRATRVNYQGQIAPPAPGGQVIYGPPGGNIPPPASVPPNSGFVQPNGFAAPPPGTVFGAPPPGNGAFVPDPNVGPIPGEVAPNVAPPGGVNFGVYPEQELPTVDFDVIATEAQTGRLMFGVGVNSNAGLIGNIVIDEQHFDILKWPSSWEDVRNGTAFRGAGQRFRVEAAPGTEVSRYVISFAEPYLFDSPISFSTAGSYYQRFFRDWREQRVSGRFGLGYQFPFRPDLSVTTGLRLEEVEITEPRTPTPPELTEVLGHNTVVGLRVGLVHDTRDSPFLPTEGFMTNYEFEQVMGSFTYPRFTAEASRYFTLRQHPDGSGRHVFKIGGEFGISGEETPIYDHFFAGGFNTLRGFRFRGASPRNLGVVVGGELQLLGTTEYMFPITADDMLRGVVFADFGTVEREIEINSENFRLAPGFGMRITVPALGPAPLAFDFAFPILEADGDENQVFAFFVGINR
jgi:outer membrane protein insertion porin family